MSFSVTSAYSRLSIEISQSDRARRLDSSMFHSCMRVESSIRQVNFATTTGPSSICLGVDTWPASLVEQTYFLVSTDLGKLLASSYLRWLLDHTSLQSLSFIDKDFIVVFFIVYIAEHIKFVQ